MAFCKVTGSKLALNESAAYPAKFSIVVFNAWMSRCEVNQLFNCPRSTDRRSTGRRSLVHRSYNENAKAQKLKCICQPANQSWATLDGEDAQWTSRSSHSYAHAPMTSCNSTHIAAGWSVLHLGDEPDAMVSPRGNEWQSLPLDDLSDAPASHIGNAWWC